MRFPFNIRSSAGAGLAQSGEQAAGGCGVVFQPIVGLILIPIGLYLVFHSEVRLINHGRVWAETELVSAEQAATITGRVKIKGFPEGEFLTHARSDRPVVYWEQELEEFIEKTETTGTGSDRRTRTVREWERQDFQRDWADFKIGGVQIRPDGAQAVGETQVFQGTRRGGGEFTTEGLGGARVGDERLTVRVIGADRELMICGDVAGGTISGGRTFVVSALNDASTEQTLRTQYMVAYWLLKAGAVLCLTVGLMMIASPALYLFGFIPFVGRGMSAAVFGAALLGSLAVVIVLTVALKFWWLLLLVLILSIGVGAWAGSRVRRRRGPSPAAVPTAVPPSPIQPPAVDATLGAMSEAPPAPPGPAAPPKAKCERCGANVEPTDRFCGSCGRWLQPGGEK